MTRLEDFLKLNKNRQICTILKDQSVMQALILMSENNIGAIIIGLAMFIFIIVFSLKRAKEKRKAQQEEHEKIKEYGENINEETRNKDK